MKEKNSSGNKAAITAQLEFDYIPGAPEYIEPWVTKETLRQHYKMGIRTINYAMALGLPSHHLGRNVRFKMSEVQVWLEKNGYRRFASKAAKLRSPRPCSKRGNSNSPSPAMSRL